MVSAEGNHRPGAFGGKPQSSEKAARRAYRGGGTESLGAVLLGYLAAGRLGDPGYRFQALLSTGSGADSGNGKGTAA